MFIAEDLQEWGSGEGGKGANVGEGGKERERGRLVGRGGRSARKSQCARRLDSGDAVTTTLSN